MKRQLKTYLGMIAFRSGLYKRFFHEKAVIVLFHRVDDRYPDDPISCTSSEFAAYCRFFRSYFTVVPLSGLLDKIRRGEDISRHLAITFDDGYKDNIAVAAPELVRHGLPACFFIATEFIGSDRIPWWDAAANIASEWMSWADVRSLSEQRFEIGAHTENHVDLGVVTGAEAEREIAGAGERLLLEIGKPITFFSYPYGRPEQITEANRSFVGESGYVCCVSAFGGTVSPGADPMRLQRQPISQWQLSPYQFGLETMLAR